MAPHVLAKAACWAACAAMAQEGEAVEDLEEVDFSFLKDLEELKNRKGE